MIVLRWLHTIWAFIVFGIFTIGAVLYYTYADLTTKEEGLLYRKTSAFNHFWASKWGKLVGINYEIVPNDKVLIHQQYIFVANHTSIADIFIAPSSIYNPMVALAKIEIGNIPLLGYCFKKAAILVDRKSKSSRFESVQRLKRLGKYGISVLIFPEGTRNYFPVRPLKPFHNGAFSLAIELGVPIVPMVLLRTRDLVPNDKLPFKRVSLKSITLDPIPTAGMGRKSVSMLRDQVYSVLEEALILHDPLFEHHQVGEPLAAKRFRA